MERIGFIGLGMMGHGMAKHLLAKGYPLTFKAHRNRSNLADLLAALTSDLPDDPNHEKDHRDDPEHMEEDAGDCEKDARDHPKDDERDREINERVHG